MPVYGTFTQQRLGATSEDVCCEAEWQTVEPKEKTHVRGSIVYFAWAPAEQFPNGGGGGKKNISHKICEIVFGYKSALRKFFLKYALNTEIKTFFGIL